MAQTSSLRGRVALITGGNSGIGLATARELARRGAQVFIAARCAQRNEAAVREIQASTGSAQVYALELDLGDFSSIKRCADDFLGRDLPLHILVNNAGVMGVHGMTASGFEMAFGTAYVGHFLLTQLLLPQLKKSAPSRIVAVAGSTHYRAKEIDWEAVRHPTASRIGLAEVGVAKLAMVMHMAELARRMSGTGVTTYSLHPGMVATDLWRWLPWPVRPLIQLAMLTPEAGAATSVYCASSPEVAQQSGLYYVKCQVREPNRLAHDAAYAEHLWRISLDWVAPALRPRALAA